MEKTVAYILIVLQIIFFILLPLWMQLTNYLHPLVIGVAWFCFSFFALIISCWVLKERIQITARALHTSIIFYSLALLILLFFRPNTQSYDSVNLVPFDTIFLYLSGEIQLLVSFYNLGANIGLFIPFGLYYRYIKKGPSFIHALLITIVSIGMIESLQFITQRGSLDVDDLLLNVLGVSIGYIIYPVIHKVLIIK